MKRCVMVALDGLRPDMLSAEHTPNLVALARQGRRFANSRSVFPSETRVATPSLVTGCRPEAHGMVANTLFDPTTAPDRLLRTKHVADVLAMAQGRDSPLERPTVGEILAAAGRSFALVSAGTEGAARLLHPAAERLGAFRWNVEDRDGPTAARVRDRFGPTPPHAVPNLERIGHAGRVLLELVLPEIRPDVALIWLSEPDISFHYAGIGAPTSLVALRAADAVLGRVMAWRAAQPDAEAIAIIALSDHGHVTGQGKRSLVEELCRAGFRAGEGMTSGIDIVVAPAAAPGIWLRDLALAPQLRDWLRTQDWAGPLLARDPAILPDGDALPLAVLGSAHRRSGDLVVTFAGSEGLDSWGLPGTAPFDAPDVPDGGGMHGGLHRAELATVLIAAGGPFRGGGIDPAACDLTDIIPTVLALLEVDADGMAGRDLATGGSAPTRRTLDLPGGFVLELERDDASGRDYPAGLRRA